MTSELAIYEIITLYIKTSFGLIESLFWPLTTIIIVILLREQIASLLKRMSKVNYKGLEINLDKSVDEVNEKFESTVNKDSFAKADKEDDNSTKNNEKLFELSELSPESAIAMSWKRLESKLLEINKNHPNVIESDHIISPMVTAQRLLRKNIISSDLYWIMRDLSEIRNGAVHQVNNSYKNTKEFTAIKYDNLVNRVVAELDDINIE